MILPLAIVTVRGAQTNLARDIDNSVEIYGRECEIWVQLDANVEVDRPDLLVISQTDCLRVGHVVSVDEDELFDLGRGLGPDIVGYYLQSDAAGFRGCAAHPPERRGFWVANSATRWTLPHELTHVVGHNPHVGDSDNLMFTPTSSITNPPPDLSDDQRTRILQDPALLSVPSIVLDL
jgi:hypothetical protein